MKLVQVLVAVAAPLLAGLVTQKCPEGMVPTGLGATCIDRYEWPNQAGVKPLVGASAVPRPEDQASGSMIDATSLCKSVGKRVCMWEEWHEACIYEAGIWPDGEHLEVVRKRGELACNNDNLYIGPVDEAAIERRSSKEFKRLDQREPSGSRERCESLSGARDMVGNAEEWVRCPERGKYGWCLMGRFWADRRSCTYTVTLHSPKWHFYETGFRCCIGE